MDNEIKLTKQELEDIKDDIKFKVKTTETLKRVFYSLKKLDGIPDKVSNLEAHRTVQWFILGSLVVVIIGKAYKLF